ncbi:hypothetical protein MAQ5080_03330 [Marinomonas aquimarina]|uniref:Uncharacterized protein n=1 Tax=Marinomonas aquimarina TaxID=295068 RepID=A0A1A8TP73_9GAMM|nr:hypothetical protein [Marinomonas aquimarina]SBS35992.1 hypothetical protein MAQ5080_03330 [Marinomonas aquimarina]
MNKCKHLALLTFFSTIALAISSTSQAQECDDRSAMTAAMDASERLMSSDSFRRPQVLKRHHPSKRKEVATYFESGDLYFTLYWIVSDNCQAAFIKRTRGKY